MKKITPLIAIITLLFFALPFKSFAQPDANSDTGDGNPEPTDAETPFDGGVTILIATAIGYGIKKAKDSKNNTPVKE